jgi:hypothetical protein
VVAIGDDVVEEGRLRFEPICRALRAAPSTSYAAKIPAARTSRATWSRPMSRPTLDALRLLRTYGPTPKAFALRRRFDPDGRPAGRRRPVRDRAWTGRGR